MTNILFGIIFILIYLTFLKNPKVGSLLYLAAALLAPNASIAAFTPRVEHILLPTLLLTQFTSLRPNRHRIQPVFYLFGIWFIWILLISIFSHYRTDWLSLYMYLRFIGVSVLFYKINWDDTDIITINLLFVFLSIFIGILSIGQLNQNAWATDLTLGAYSPANAAVINNQLNNTLSGILFRGVGVFGNVSPAGAFFTLSLAISLFLVSHIWRSLGPGRKMILAGGLISSLIGGFCTLSGTFFGGLMCIPPLFLLIVDSQYIKTTVKIVITGFILISAVTIVFLSNNESLRDQFDYQVRGILSGERFLGRYGDTDAKGEYDGVMKSALTEVSANPIQGVGVVKSDDFTGDSFFVSLIYFGGLVGVFLFITPIMALCFKSWQLGGLSRIWFLWTAIFFIACISTSGFWLARIGDWWWAIQGVILKSFLNSIAKKSALKTIPSPSEVGQAIGGRS